jgi:hypothetical protein
MAFVVGMFFHGSIGRFSKVVENDRWTKRHLTVLGRD